MKSYLTVLLSFFLTLGLCSQAVGQTPSMPPSSVFYDKVKDGTDWTIGRPDSRTGPGQAEPVKVGIIYPLSGDTTELSEGSLRGLAIAYENLKNNRPGSKLNIEFKFYDNAKTEEGTKLALKKAVKDNVVAVIGPTGSKLAFAIADDVKASELPMVLSRSVSHKITPRGIREKESLNYIFRVCFNDSVQGIALADYVRKDLKKAGAVIIYDDSDYQAELIHTFKTSFKAQGGQVVKESYFEVSIDNKMIQKAGQKVGVTPDFIFVALTSRHCKDFIEQLRQNQITLPVLVGGGFYQSLLSDMKNNPNDLYLGFHWVENQAQPTAFSKEFRTRYPGIPTIVDSAPLAYDTFNVLVQAIRNVSGPVNRSSVRASLARISRFPGVTGEITFDEKGECLNKPLIICRVKNGTLGNCQTIREVANSPTSSTSKSTTEKENIVESPTPQPTSAPAKKDNAMLIGLIFILLALVGVGAIIWGGVIIIKRIIRRFRSDATTCSAAQRDSFEPIKNVYVVGNPVKPGDNMFFGREEDFREVRNWIKTDGPKVILLRGGRRSGKTSILLQILYGRLGEEGEAINCDFHSIAPKVAHDEDLPLQIGQAVLANDKFSDLKEILHQQGHSATANLGRMARECLTRIHPRKLLFLCDEYEAIEEHFETGKLSPRALMWARDLLTLPVHFIMTGSRDFEGVLRPVLSDVCVIREISMLSERDTLDLIRLPVKNTLEYRDKTAKMIYRLSGGHPFYTQLICQTLVNHINANLFRRYALPDDISATVNFILRNPAGHIQESWRSLSVEAKKALAALANTLKYPTDYTDEDSVLATAEKLRFRLEPQQYYEAIAWFKEKTHLLEWDSGMIRFKQDLIRCWVRYSYQTGEQIADGRG
ncbi:MAG: ABC transporter substrate-binding protein [Deltaproteobacteria bacterium]|nr:ABC transporter substrate-binding protein [Deltaproteobacteria bacterium]